MWELYLVFNDIHFYLSLKLLCCIHSHLHKVFFTGYWNRLNNTSEDGIWEQEGFIIVYFISMIEWRAVKEVYSLVNIEHLCEKVLELKIFMEVADFWHRGRLCIGTMLLSICCGFGQRCEQDNHLYPLPIVVCTWTPCQQWSIFAYYRSHGLTAIILFLMVTVIVWHERKAQDPDSWINNWWCAGSVQSCLGMCDIPNPKLFYFENVIIIENCNNVICNICH